ncbi:hypothetical protein [Sinisalibacter aestuarii]|nr:hypothetical protein [Sinisalibacter aestuarii]
MNRDHEVLFYLEIEPEIRLSHDGHQWILEQEDPNGEDPYWFRHFQRIALVQSTRAVLLQCIIELSIDLPVEERRLLAALPEDYWSFYEDWVNSGRDRRDRLLDSAEGIPPIPVRLVVSREVRLERINLWRANRPRRLTTPESGPQSDEGLLK